MNYFNLKNKIVMALTGSSRLLKFFTQEYFNLYVNH
jgi:hypothetical protein